MHELCLACVIVFCSMFLALSHNAHDAYDSCTHLGYSRMYTSGRTRSGYSRLCVEAGVSNAIRLLQGIAWSGARVVSSD